jgi:hypothetical protein
MRVIGKVGGTDLATHPTFRFTRSNTTKEETRMAKGSMRPGKEARKPKKDAKAKGATSKEAAAPVIAIRAKKTEK